MEYAVIGFMKIAALYAIFFVCSLIWKGLKLSTKTVVNKVKKK